MSASKVAPSQVAVEAEGLEVVGWAKLAQPNTAILATATAAALQRAVALGFASSAQPTIATIAGGKEIQFSTGLTMGR